LRVSFCSDCCPSTTFSSELRNAPNDSALFLDTRNLLVRPVERLADRVQHRLDGLLAIGEVAQRLRLLLAEQLVRERRNDSVLPRRAVPATASNPERRRSSARSSESHARQ
jgi:hypothetical protein